MTDMTPLTNATNALLAANLRLSDILSLLEDTYSGFPANTETVMTFGAGTEYATFEDLWNYLADKTIAGPLRVQIPDGVHVLDKPLQIGPHPWARNIRFIGNLISPSNVIFQVLNGPEVSSHAEMNGLHFVGMQGTELSGVTFTGSGAGSTSLGLGVEQGTYLYSQDGSVHFQGLDTGFFVNEASAWQSLSMTIQTCLNGGHVADGALLRAANTSFLGRGYGEGVGLKCQDAGVVQAYEATADGYQFGFYADSSGHIGVGNSAVYRCTSGYYCRAGTIFNFSSADRDDIGAFECRQGYDAQSGGRIFATRSRSENCRSPLLARNASFIDATNHRVVENDTGKVPDYSATAYFFDAGDLCLIRADSATWTKVRDNTYKSTTGTNAIVSL